MSIVKSDPNVETVGVSPKVAWPTAALVAIGVALLVLDSLGVIVIDDSIWTTLIGAGLAAGGIGAVSPPAQQRVKVGAGPANHRTRR